ncbi:acylamino-acid-releasing enzyme-like isoform X2 [Cimex lectularius]|uniref:acylaminoacyl-peptidase n=1 Tax=Cimex lectularius TaxID=79782 RepID=A0A8I6RI34_CIMLE|nr:acylamino-acid-releasing enzyme-like isoform X2 [Cimex lectularius]
MDKVINVFKEVIKNSVPVSGKILKSPESALLVCSKWSQRNVERKMSVSSELLQIVDMDTSNVTSLSSVDITSELITKYSPSGKYRGLFRDIPASGKYPKKQHLELWYKNRMYRNCDVSIFDLHGDVYNDSEFACFEWSPCEKKILYVAEKKKPKAEPFLPLPAKKNDDVLYGSEYLFTEEWGEALVGKSSPVLAIYDVETNTVSLLNGAPPDLSLGQGVWAPDGGVVCVAWNTLPRRLGLVYCTNRLSWICHISPDGKFTKLSSDGLAVRSPKFSPNGESLVWLERKAGGPHHACHSLMKFDWVNKKTKTVIDIVDEYSETKNGSKFYGLYNLSLGNCWLSDNKTIVVSTPQMSSVRTFSVDTDSHELVDLTGSVDEESYSLGVLDVSNDILLCYKSCIAETPYLVVGRYRQDEEVTWIPLTTPETICKDFTFNVLKLESDDSSNVKNFSAIYYGPKNKKDTPLLVCPHGGPHSAYTNSYSMIVNFFAQLGFASLLVNYRGSIGAGQNSVNFVLGKVGNSDVNDVHQAVQSVLKQYSQELNQDKVVLFGGSHGGFIVLHLAGQYPKNYSCVVALNPVSDLSKPFGSDIPDWALTEGGFSYSPLTEMTGEVFESLRKMSPLYYIDKVESPILLLMGKKDLRVHPTQAHTFFQSLKARGVKTKMLCYDDNHSLSQTPHEVDFCINSALWYLDIIDHNID